MVVPDLPQPNDDALEAYRSSASKEFNDPGVGALVHELIGHVADKRTMIILEVLAEKGELRFTRLSEQVPGISYKMLPQTLRLMEREGFVARTVHPVVPPRVDYKLTELGVSLAIAFCNVWMWAEGHLEQVESARTAFDRKVASAKVDRNSQQAKSRLSLPNSSNRPFPTGT